MARYLLDTDIMIDYLRGVTRSRSLFEQIGSGKAEGFLSVITVVELYSFKKMNDPMEVEKVRRLLSLFNIVDLDFQIAVKAGELRRNYSCNFPDAVVAATTYMHKLQLLTRNTKHYTMIKELNMREPY